MNVIIRPDGALSGSVTPPVSKSDLHRLLICAALADRPCEIAVPGGTSELSQDIYATMDCLTALGAQFATNDSGIAVTPPSEPPQTAVLNCRESGSTLRFLLPVAAALGVSATIIGQGRLPQRPIDTMTALLRQSGVRVGDTLPLDMSGRLAGGEFALPGNISSQYVSGLLFAAPLTGQACKITLTSPPESTEYIDMTVFALQKFGIAVRALPDGWEIPAGQRYTVPPDTSALCAEGDWSSAAFWITLGALSEDGITVSGLSKTSSQPDRAILRIVRDIGAVVTESGGSFTVKEGQLRPINVDVSGFPDLAPALAVLMANIPGVSRIENAARLRIKESDRLAACAANLAIMGVRVTETADSLEIHGGALTGAAMFGYDDHRIVMAFAVAAACASGTSMITDAESVKKSYPQFFEDYNRLGGCADVV
ncbi:MAG: 3-phosphoshikimate 1-carboxyvinyltransferase [Oscillospiraceae bacterium]|jgi:3-phosphoshikimate 1-carboxyvinyltransferase|nr:3-phosphoshikimate 1-carboxyvinyltransferase [Oscillospiraceae bacterium]